MTKSERLFIQACTGDDPDYAPFDALEFILNEHESICKSFDVDEETDAKMEVCREFLRGIRAAYVGSAWQETEQAA